MHKILLGCTKKCAIILNFDGFLFEKYNGDIIANKKCKNFEKGGDLNV